MEAVALLLTFALYPDELRVAAELRSFPSYEAAKAAREECGQYLLWLSPRVVLNDDVPQFGWRDHQKWANRVYEAWSELEDARWPGSGKENVWRPPGCARRHADALKDLIGEDAYAIGRMPPALKPPPP